MRIPDPRTQKKIRTRARTESPTSSAGIIGFEEAQLIFKKIDSAIRRRVSLLLQRRRPPCSTSDDLELSTEFVKSVTFHKAITLKFREGPSIKFAGVSTLSEEVVGKLFVVYTSKDKPKTVVEFLNDHTSTPGDAILSRGMISSLLTVETSTESDRPTTIRRGSESAIAAPCIRMVHELIAIRPLKFGDPDALPTYTVLGKDNFVFSDDLVVVPTDKILRPINAYPIVSKKIPEFHDEEEDDSEAVKFLLVPY